MNTPWPLGEIPNHLQRPELKQLRELGYVWKYPHEVVDIFEKKMATFTGSKYAIATDCNTHGIFLVLKGCLCLKTNFEFKLEEFMKKKSTFLFLLNN